MEKLRKIFLFYYEGFRGMTVGKTLWTIILIKLFIMFAGPPFWAPTKRKQTK